MEQRETLGPFCQSCGMPLAKPEDFGIKSDGYRINDYCVHCFAGGAFTQPNITMQEMIDQCTSIMAEAGILPSEQARALMNKTAPNLARWRKN